MTLNHKNALALVTALVLGIFLMPSFAQAQTKVAVVDIEKILAESAAAKSIQGQVETQRKAFLSEIEKEEKKLREEQQKIEKDRANLTKEDLTKKAQEFETKRLEARNLLQKRKASLDKAYGEAMGKLGSEISVIVRDVAKEKGYDLVITKQNVIIGSNELDLTDTVMKLLNEKLPSVQLKIQ